MSGIQLPKRAVLASLVFCIWGICCGAQSVEPTTDCDSTNSGEDLALRLTGGSLSDFERGVHARLGLSLTDENEFAAAWQHLQLALEAGVDNWGIHLAAAQVCLYWLLDHDCVETHANRALALYPDNARARLYLGQAAHDLGRVEEALHYYRSALEIRPGETEISIRLANLLNNAGRPAEARAVLWHTQQLDPRSSRILLLLASLHEPDDPQTAEEIYLRAVEVSNEPAITYVYLMRFYQRQGRTQAARRVQTLIDEISSSNRQMRPIGPTVLPPAPNNLQ